MDMAVHDILFNMLAEEENVTLTSQEEATVETTAQDFWDDLTEEQQERIAVTEEDIQETMRQIAVAQKYQTSLSEKNEIDYEKYAFDGDAYKAILNDHTYKSNDQIWGLLDFGNIVLEH